MSRGLGDVYKRHEYKNLNVEIKCPPTPDNHHKYITQDMDEKHEYFWQIQGEMDSQSKSRGIECTKTLFVSYHPYFPEGFQLGNRIVEASKLHQTAIKIRCIIAERIVVAMMKDFWKRPSDFLPDAIKDIPDNYEDIIMWYQKEVVKYEPYK